MMMMMMMTKIDGTERFNNRQYLSQKYGKILRNYSILNSKNNKQNMHTLNGENCICLYNKSNACCFTWHVELTA